MSFIDVVVDISHYNQADLSAVKNGGIVGVFHKASGGTGMQDSQYHGRCQQAKDAGLLWGAYHFGNGSDGVAQAEFFLHAIDPLDGCLPVLDFEQNPYGSSMSLDQARAFVTYIHDVTGVWPGLYGGGYLKQVLGSQADPVLKNCWLWVSQYASSVTIPANWPAWTFWQYTEKGTVPGVTGDCDRDRFNGTQDDLIAFWQQNAISQPVQAVAQAPAQS